MSEVPSFYNNYLSFKKWNGEAPSSPDQFEEFLLLSGLKPPATILEIGFGEGAFLDWAAARGYQISGIELIPELVERVQLRHSVWTGTVIDVNLPSAKFDGVFAIDVFEHIPVPDLKETLNEIARILRPGGTCVVRFPNGASPFFGRYMYGDLTHTTFLTESAIRQLVESADLDIVRVCNPRPRAKGLFKSLRRGVAYAMRDLIETIVSNVYFGFRFPMDPNLLVVFSSQSDLTGYWDAIGRRCRCISGATSFKCRVSVLQTLLMPGHHSAVQKRRKK